MRALTAIVAAVLYVAGFTLSVWWVTEVVKWTWNR